MYPLNKNLQKVDRRINGINRHSGSILVLILIFIFICGGYSRAYAIERLDLKTTTSSLEPTGDQHDRQPVSQQEGWVYYTQPGDTLETIAARFQVRPQNIHVPEPLKVGQRLSSYILNRN